MFPQLDFSRIRTNSISGRTSKVTLSSSARPVDPDRETLAAFIDSLPAVLKADDLRTFSRLVAASRAGNFPVVFMMGAHVVKCGLAPIVIDLMERGLLTAVAMNSAAAIHDSESALFGVTSEDVATNLRDGSFGMWRETGDFINGTLSRAYAGQSCGYGEALGTGLADAAAPHLGSSILAAAVRLGIPVSVHAAIGTDIVHQQPSMDGAATGEMSFRDFKVLCHALTGLQGGGAVLNVGSAVLLPEVFLKALTVIRNLGFDAAGFATANFDMIQHYRPAMNVVARPTQDSGAGYSFTGHHEVMIPLLAAMIKREQARQAGA
jgi:hypothetical protein